MTAKKKAAGDEIEVIGITTNRATYHIVGTTPLIFNRMTEKAKRELTLPTGRKTAADKASRPKHDLLSEYRDSPYAYRDRDDTETFLYLPHGNIKQMIAAAALDMPGGASKAKIGRLIRIVDRHIPIYGAPEMLLSVVRSADMNRTPDIRSRCILPEWCASFTVEFPTPQLTASAVAKLVAGGGHFIGVGDWRQQKGSGDHGLFSLVDEDDADLLRIRAGGARDAQVAGWQTPVPHDAETAELLDWYTEEFARRYPKLVEPAVAAE